MFTTGMNSKSANNGEKPMRCKILPIGSTITKAMNNT
jgi:hypothetical protein